MNKTLLATAISTLFLTTPVFAFDNTTESDTAELKKVIAEQKAALKTLEARLTQTEQRIESAAEQFELAAPKSATKIGGYGELHYNNLDDNKTIDFHRFVLFASHQFTDKLRFNSELEVEHVIASNNAEHPGEVELEQAYIEYDVSENATIKAGLFLVPVGIINETHEPPAFYGVERNPVEKNIIPATWWEGGAAVNYRPQAGVSLDFALTSGLAVDESYKIRGGRQKVAEANADSLAFTSRVKYTAIAGLELAATLQYQQDVAQSLNAVEKASATLLEAHGIYSVDNFTVKALYARWDIDGAEAKALGRDEQTGWYIEPSYKLSEQFGIFARYAEYDNNAGNSDDSSKDQTNIGINYYLHENVVLKADWEEHGDSDKNGFNLGLGYQF
jgi:predicted porin